MEVTQKPVQVPTPESQPADDKEQTPITREVTVMVEQENRNKVPANKTKKAVQFARTPIITEIPRVNTGPWRPYNESRSGRRINRPSRYTD